MNAKKSDHVVVDFNTKEMVCRNCGSALPIPFPIDLNVFAAMGKAFSKNHRACQACQPKKNEQP